MGILSFLSLYSKPLFSKCIPNFNNVSVRNVELAHRIYGDQAHDTPVVILHGLMGMKKNWHSMAKNFNEFLKRKVIAVDARNHGQSPHTTTHTYFDLANDVKELIAKLNIQNVVLIGHSMGGRTAMAVALSEPTLVKGLIVIDISPISMPDRFEDFWEDLFRAMSAVDFKGLTSSHAARIKANQKLKEVAKNDAELNSFLLSIGKREDGTYGWMCNIETLNKHILDMKEFPDEFKQKKYEGPTLFLSGKNSNYIPKKDYEPIRNQFPNSRIEIVENAGHNLHAENPKKFGLLATNFINELVM